MPVNQMPGNQMNPRMPGPGTMVPGVMKQGNQMQPNANQMMQSGGNQGMGVVMSTMGGMQGNMNMTGKELFYNVHFNLNIIYP